MSKATTAEIRKVIDAFDAGKTIQSRERNSGDPFRPAERPAWDFFAREYRVKPEPRVVWVNDFETGLGVMAHRSKSEAVKIHAPRIVKFVEVLEDDQ